MPEMRWFLLSLFFLLLSLFAERSCVDAAPRKATIQGTREANLRVGPGTDQGIRGILKENEPLTVEGEQGEWYLVETTTGLKGYVNKNFVKLEPGSVIAKPDERVATGKAPSLIELLEGREGDMMLWAGIAIVFFLIGWIFGGHYYLRRDRARRTR